MQDAADKIEVLRSLIKVTKADVCCRFHLAGNCVRGDKCSFLHPDSVPPPPAAPEDKGKTFLYYTQNYTRGITSRSTERVYIVIRKMMGC